MTITKEGGVYTAVECTKDGRVIECQAMSAREAIAKVCRVIAGGLISGY